MVGEGGVAIITGSASGIGAATALALAARGWNVVINALQDLKKAEETARACNEGSAGKAIVCLGDVSRDADCRRIVVAALEAWGRLDALVNSAATTRPVSHADLEGLSAEDFQQAFAV